MRIPAARHHVHSLSWIAVSAVLWLTPLVALGEDAGLPQLRKQGNATQLIVDGRPLVMLAGELHNSSSSSLEYMKPIWPRLASLNLNTVIASISWELVEPEEGKFDFSLVDGLIEGARRHDLKLVFIWFATWKNGDEASWKVNLGPAPRVLIGRVYRYP